MPLPGLHRRMKTGAPRREEPQFIHMRTTAATAHAWGLGGLGTAWTALLRQYPGNVMCNNSGNSIPAKK
jgi:hypothetical protein